MIRRSVTIATILILTLITVRINALREEIGLRFQNAPTDLERIAVIKEYIPKSEDVELLRTLQDIWIDLDREGSEAYFLEKYETNPASEIYHYLWARSLSNDAIQQEEARKIIAKYPDFRYGYLLLSYLYNSFLFLENSHPEIDYRALLLSYDKDKELLKQWFEKHPQDDQALFTMYYMSFWLQEYAEAEKYLLLTEGITSTWANYQLIMAFCTATKTTKAYTTLFPGIISESIAMGTVSRADSLYMYAGYYIYLLRSNKDWETLDNYLQEQPAVREYDFIKRILVGINIEREQYDKSLEMLEELLEKGSINYRTLGSTDEWLALHKIKGWEELLDKAEQKWEAERPARKKEALSNKLNTKSPLWELADFEGNKVKLQDFSGKTVVIYFWASWSTPSHQVMQQLNQWTIESKPAGVEVFAINIWEQDPENAELYVSINDYRMKILAGTEQTPELYGLNSIPYLAVIDKKGVIRYIQNGITDNLDEKLTWWTEGIR